MKTLVSLFGMFLLFIVIFVTIFAWHHREKARNRSEDRHAKYIVNQIIDAQQNGEYSYVHTGDPFFAFVSEKFCTRTIFQLFENQSHVECVIYQGWPNRVPAESLAYFNTMPDLDSLKFVVTDFEPGAFVSLKDGTRLSSLVLDRCAFDFESLEHLETLTQLKEFAFVYSKCYGPDGNILEAPHYDSPEYKILMKTPEYKANHERIVEVISTFQQLETLYLDHDFQADLEYLKEKLPKTKIEFTESLIEF